MEENVLTKKCSKCGRELPLERFSKSNTRADGRQSKCKECMAEYNRERYQKIKEKNDGQPHLSKVFLNPELAKFQPRELIAELRARGYSGELSIRQVITV